MSIQDMLREELRLTIIVTLNEVPGQSAYEGLLQEAIARYHNQFPTRAELQAELIWLRDAGLLTIAEHPQPGRVSYTATLTARGEATATGRLKTAGVRRPNA
ncbi:hypothetical protein T8K17_01850 [Thalassobaculum sp. OXR-137]|uniref:hypothetical protein n=1 Tax=Thalassobaculum sp. OXR-137 TaxID=3100173 RepID=UPI002AC94A1E|nr:hypothetical protein [Thalassobaculum sp. OXR-137]WPZ33213.1 hypothetical protein T8K17_18465 [Thalassobaculum sp. OXR-137]WPZ34894.1 hypothetical protein T8K17_01850 [Thalassobaculum sp. OXR-137]